MTKNSFLDWLYFEHRARVTYKTNANAQTIYTAKTPRERLTFKAEPVAILQVIYKPNDAPQAVNRFDSFADFINANPKTRAKT